MRHSFRWALYGALAVVLLAAGWSGYRAYRVYSDLHTMIGVKKPRLATEPTVVIPPLNGNQRINFLVLGSDNDKKKEEARPNTQSMILVTVNPRARTVGMLSIPRDFWVRIGRRGMAKIDMAYRFGDVQLARATVERLFGVPIDYYAWVGLDGFIKVIDTFNGVTLNVSHPILDDYYPDDLNSTNPYGYTRVFIPPGWQYMGGSQALQYVRSRHGDRIGDFGRSARQQQVLLQLKQKINALDVLKNLPGLVNDLRGRVKTDLGFTELYQLAQLSKQIPPGNIRQVVLAAPTYSRYGFARNFLGYQSVVLPNWKRIRPVVRSMFAPLPPATPRPTATMTATPRTAATATPTPRQSATVTPPPAATATPTPTPAPPTLSRLPGNLLYVRNGNIVRMSRNEAVVPVTTDAQAPVRYGMLSVSPDGRSLAYIKFTRYASDLWVRALRGGKPRRLTSDQNQRDVHANLWAAWPSWAADGKSILFSWDRQKLALPESEARPVDLAVWRLSVSGGDPQQLTQPALGAGGDTDVAARPGSGQYVYVRWDYLTPSNQSYSQLMLKDPTNPSATYALTKKGGVVLQPAWSPTGNRLAFVRTALDGSIQIVVAPVHHTPNGPVLGARTVLDSGKVAQPSFSPDGRWVSYLKYTGSAFQLFVVRSTGGAPRLVPTAGSGIDATVRPVWTR